MYVCSCITKQRVSKRTVSSLGTMIMGISILNVHVSAIGAKSALGFVTVHLLVGPVFPGFSCYIGCRINFV